ncbi:MAG: hypothetical protein WC928_02855 [Patescibacteria group bacterium]|jgi:hypothetical protein
MKKNKKFILLAIIVFLFLFFLYIFKFANHYPRKIESSYEKDYFGITYSKKYAEEIGLDWQEAYLAMIDELEVKNIRIPVYWDEIEKESGVFDFSDYDFLIVEGEKRGVNFILNFGMRVARWPECHFPTWLEINDKKNLEDKTLRMLEVVLDHYKSYDSISYWQLENEPLLDSFGVCPPSDYDFLKKELELVKKIDSRPVIISATGELSFWRKEVRIADIFGTTMYRVVYNPWLGYIKYPYSSGFYRLKANLANLDLAKAFVIELQAEPWIPKESVASIYNINYQKSFNLERFKANVQFAKNTKFQKVYLWGAEWWYFKHKLGGNSDYWNFAKTLFP